MRFGRLKRHETPAAGSALADPDRPHTGRAHTSLAVCACLCAGGTDTFGMDDGANLPPLFSAAADAEEAERLRAIATPERDLVPLGLRDLVAASVTSERRLQGDRARLAAKLQSELRSLTQLATGLSPGEIARRVEEFERSGTVLESGLRSRFVFEAPWRPVARLTLRSSASDGPTAMAYFRLEQAATGFRVARHCADFVPLATSFLRAVFHAMRETDALAPRLRLPEPYVTGAREVFETELAFQAGNPALNSSSTMMPLWVQSVKNLRELKAISDLDLNCLMYFYKQIFAPKKGRNGDPPVGSIGSGREDIVVGDEAMQRCQTLDVDSMKNFIGPLDTSRFPFRRANEAPGVGEAGEGVQIEKGIGAEVETANDAQRVRALFNLAASRLRLKASRAPTPEPSDGEYRRAAGGLGLWAGEELAESAAKVLSALQQLYGGGLADVAVVKAVNGALAGLDAKQATLVRSALFLHRVCGAVVAALKQCAVNAAVERGSEKTEIEKEVDAGEGVEEGDEGGAVGLQDDEIEALFGPQGLPPFLKPRVAALYQLAFQRLAMARREGVKKRYDPSPFRAVSATAGIVQDGEEAAPDAAGGSGIGAALKQFSEPCFTKEMEKKLPREALAYYATQIAHRASGLLKEAGVQKGLVKLYRSLAPCSPHKTYEDFFVANGGGVGKGKGGTGKGVSGLSKKDPIKEYLIAYKSVSELHALLADPTQRPLLVFDDFTLPTPSLSRKTSTKLANRGETGKAGETEEKRVWREKWPSFDDLLRAALKDDASHPVVEGLLVRSAKAEKAVRESQKSIKKSEVDYEGYDDEMDD